MKLKLRKYFIFNAAVNFLCGICIFISLFSLWLRATYCNVSLSQLIFTLKTPLAGTESSLVISFITDIVIPTALFMIAISYITKIIVMLYNHKRSDIIRILSKSIIAVVLVIAAVLSVCSAARFLGVTDYIESLSHPSSLYENYYINPKNVNLEFPSKKRNLIYIFLESMEWTDADYENGGAFEYNLIPNLTRLAEENQSFSNSDKFGGAMSTAGTSWTSGGLISQTSGIPLNVPVTAENFSDVKPFMPGIWSIGDILNEQGYNQTFLIGSDADFGGRKAYFSQHGNYYIRDYFEAKNLGNISDSYKVWWGYEDKKLFSFAKEELQNLASKNEPFNLTMLTVDTHHIGGYICDLCGYNYHDQYSNVIACSDKQVYEFVSWIMEQDFYENTTIVISGDHPSMDPDYFNNIPNGYVRTTYNCIINAAVSTKNYKNRQFTTMDMYPTTLAAMGIKIDGNQMGLGINLYSGKETLCEKLGYDVLNSEIAKNSEFYNNNILK